MAIFVNSSNYCKRFNDWRQIAAPTFGGAITNPIVSFWTKESKKDFLSLSHGKTPKVAAQNIQTE